MIIVGVGIVVIRDDKVLLGCRKGDYGCGSWSLPGGKVEQGETVFQAGTRELEEETSLLSVGNLEMISVSEDISPAKHSITFGVYLPEWEGEAKNNEEDKFSRWDWFALTDLPTPLFPPTLSVLLAFASNKTASPQRSSGTNSYIVYCNQLTAWKNCRHTI